MKNTTTFSLIQIASENSCYLIDCFTLSKNANYYSNLKNLIDLIINNQSILKIGYSIDSDYRMISQAYLSSKPKNTLATDLFDPQNTLDLRELFYFLVDDSKNYVNLFDTDHLQIAKSLSGLSQITFLLTGSCVDKMEQMSDWTRRPLRQSQISYAAIDACCLVDCYKKLIELFDKKLEISFETFIADDFKSRNSCQQGEKKLILKFYINLLLSGERTTKTNLQLKSIENKIPRELIPIKEFRCVIDDMLYG